MKSKLYKVSVYSKYSYGPPLGSYIEVRVYIDEKPMENVDEAFIYATALWYYKERAEVRVYTEKIKEE